MKIGDRIYRPETFKDRLKTIMSIRKMTQSDLSKATGLSKGGISNYVTGRYKPKEEIITKLALALDCSEAWLRGYDVPMRREQKYIVYDEVTGTYDDEDPLLIEIYSYLDTFTQEERKQLHQYLKDKDKSFNNISFPTSLNKKESRVLFAYRSHPEMHPAIDKLLGIEESNKNTIYTTYNAAQSADNHEGYVQMETSRWDKMESAPKTDDDLL